MGDVSAVIRFYWLVCPHSFPQQFTWLTRRQVAFHDWKQLHQLSEGNREFEIELLQMFVEDTSARLVVIKDAIANADFLEVEQQAHHLKGASANVGATPIHTAATALEQKMRAQTLVETDKLITNIETFNAQIQSFLAQQNLC